MNLPIKKHYPTLIFILISLCFTFSIFKSAQNLGIRDWDQHLFYHEVPRITMKQYHQIPLWNPYYCGGTVMLANPQSRIATPFFILHLVFGTILGIKIEILLHLALGLIGMYFLSRIMGLNKLTAYVPPAVYMLSSMFFLNLLVGMTWFLSVAYIPWVFLFLILSYKNYIWIWWAATAMALIFTEGGAYTFTITFLGLITYFGFYSPFHNIFKNLKHLAIFFALTFCIGAIKFLPTIEFMLQHPRLMSDYSGFSIQSILYSLFNTNQGLDAVWNFTRDSGIYRGMSYWMDENGMYIGYLSGILFFLGFLFSFRRPWWKLSLFFLIFLWLSFGNRPSVSAWEILNSIPIYNMMRVAQRFRIIMLFFLALIAGFGLQELLIFINKKTHNSSATKLLGILLIIILYMNLFFVNGPLLEKAFPFPPQKIYRSDTFQQISTLPPYKNSDSKSKTYNATPSSLYPGVLSNLGTIQGYETATVPRNAIPLNSPEYKGEVFLEKTLGTATIDYWSPNKLIINLKTKNKGYLVVNQNYYPGWKCKENKPVININGQFGVETTPQDQRITLYYLPNSFIIGSLISLITIPFLLFFLTKSRKIWHLI